MQQSDYILASISMTKRKVKEPGTSDALRKV